MKFTRLAILDVIAFKYKAIDGSRTSFFQCFNHSQSETNIEKKVPLIQNNQLPSRNNKLPHLQRRIPAHEICTACIDPLANILWSLITASLLPLKNPIRISLANAKSQYD
ncbi:hypothetical protein BH11PSE12_BH11PSE12_23740 [soil metagenome]